MVRPEALAVRVHPVQAALALALTGAAIAMALIGPRIDVAAPEIAPALPTASARPVAATLPPVARGVALPGKHANDLHLVIEAGGVDYVKLADADRVASMAKRPTIAFVGEGDATAVQVLRGTPAAFADWAGREIVIEEKCRARVVGFAIVTQIVGERAYTGDAGDDVGWDAASIVANGKPVLAAKLDNDPRCTGHFARDAAEPPIAVAIVTHDATLEAAAKELAMHSPIAKQEQRVWREGGNHGAWLTKESTIDAAVLTHPFTGQQFVRIHASSFAGCGYTNTGLIAIYRVNADRSLAPVDIRADEMGYSLDAEIDADGDGDFERLGRDWPSADTVYAPLHGKVIDTLEIPFYGCPC